MEWYLLKSGRVEGPFNSDYMQSKIGSGDLTNTDLICRKGDRHWRPVTEFEGEFVENVETEPTLRPWIVLVENNPSLESSEAQPHYVQSGPYSTAQIIENIESGKTKYSDYIWKPGFEKWLRINEVDDFFTSPSSETEQSIKFENNSDVVFEEAPINKSDLQEVVQQVSPTTAFEEEKPIEAEGLDQLSVEPLIKQSESQVKYPIFRTDLNSDFTEEVFQESSFSQKLEEKIEVEKDEAIVAEKPKRGIKSLSLIALVLSTLALAIVGLICVWYFLGQTGEEDGFNVHPARKSSHVDTMVSKNIELAPQEKKPDMALSAVSSQPTPTKKPAILPEPVKIALHKTVAPKPLTQASKTAHKNGMVSKLAKIYEKKASLLDRQYRQLQGNPLAWKNFYLDWRGELDAPSLKSPEISGNEFRALLGNRKRLLERSEMMNRAVLESKAVSSDFEEEDLPQVFRKLQKR